MPYEFRNHVDDDDKFYRGNYGSVAGLCLLCTLFIVRAAHTPYLLSSFSILIYNVRITYNLVGITMKITLLRYVHHTNNFFLMVAGKVIYYAEKIVESLLNKSAFTLHPRFSRILQFGTTL